MTRILMKNVTMLTYALILYFRDRVLVSEMMCRILVLLVTAFSSVTRVRTANPMALLVRRAPAKVAMTARWWTESREKLPMMIMSIVSAMWIPRLSMIRSTAICEEPYIRSARRAKLCWSAKTARIPETPAEILARKVERHLCVLLVLVLTWLGTQGSRRTEPRS